ncbi:MAG: L-serine ammonia-lyase, iron-sulfur-dependent, subunit alpha [Filifactoraceae bacterium]
MNFGTGERLLKVCEENNLSISEVMLKRELEISKISEKEILSKMKHSYEIMKKATKCATEEETKTMGGLIGGEAKKLKKQFDENKNIAGTLTSKAIMYAMGVLEVNASMGLIVAAPTAGSSGVIPGVFVALQEERAFSDEAMVKALFNAGAIGYLITRNATVAGADGGCQAEIGAASAMAASAITELMGGSPRQCLNAASTAIANILGLVCDPIAGLVESPCQKRNGMGASNAIISAEITLAGIGELIPFDQVVEAMYKVGKSLPFELRESALGGMAGTLTGCSLCQKIFPNN